MSPIISDSQCIESYRRHQQLFAAADELGMRWQTLYSRLKAVGEPVSGNKSRWGSQPDRFAAKGEALFRELVPFSQDQNGNEFQSKLDFLVRGYGVDVKSAKQKRSHGRYKSTRWAFYLKKQLEEADFYVCLGFCAEGEKLERAFLIPRDLINGITTLSIPASANSKWHCFEVRPSDLASFFQGLPDKKEVS